MAIARVRCAAIVCDALCEARRTGASRARQRVMMTIQDSIQLVTMARAPTASDASRADDDAYVDTCDGALALERTAARALADRLFYGGFFALPWLWVLNAWFFAPHARGAPGSDAHIAARARASRALASAAFAAFAAWAVGFYVGGRALVGDAFFERWSATTREGGEL